MSGFGETKSNMVLQSVAEIPYFWQYDLVSSEGTDRSKGDRSKA